MLKEEIKELKKSGMARHFESKKHEKLERNSKMKALTKMKK